jgi:hypothetical protein
MAEYDEDFDPCDAFERFEVDEDAINRRRDAYEEVERQARQEQLMRQIALEEERAEQRRTYEKEAAARAARREEYILLLPSRLARIEEDELRLERPPPSNWPPAAGFGDLCMTEREFERSFGNLASLQPAADPCPSTDERGEKIGWIRQMELYSKNLERLKSVFHLPEDQLVTDSHSGRLYQQMCVALISAVREGPYIVDYRRLGCNMRNPHARRLRAYVQQGGWGSYDQIDVADGWVKLFQLMLVVRPGCSRDESSALHDYHWAVRRVLERYREAVQVLRTRPAGALTFGEEDSDINRVIRSTLGKMEAPEGHLKRLYRRLCAEEEAVCAYLASDTWDEMAEVRRISRECMELTADTFVERPNSSAVRLLRQIVFGSNPVAFQSIRDQWPSAVNQLSPSFDLYNRALAAVA